MNGGYGSVTVGQLANGLWAWKAGQISFSAFRVYLACFEMLNVRKAAARVVKPVRRQRKITPRYRLREIGRLTSLKPRTIQRALGDLQRARLLTFAESTIQVAESPVVGAEGEWALLACGRSERRPIPLPRPLLRFLARNPTAGLTKVILAYVLRGLSIGRRTGVIGNRGTVKASWIEGTFGLGLRAVRYAQANLRQAGWISKDTGSFQRKLNRDGAYFVINLEWNPPGQRRRLISDRPSVIVNPDKPCSEIAPLRPENGRQFAPPTKDKESSIEVKHQEALPSEVTGVCSVEAAARRPSPQQEALPTPSLWNIVPTDLQRLSRIKVLYSQAAHVGWIQPSEAAGLNFLAAAVRARQVVGDPVRVFVGIVKAGLWQNITQDQEEQARRAFARLRDGDPGWFDTTKSSQRSQPPRELPAPKTSCSQTAARCKFYASEALGTNEPYVS